MSQADAEALVRRYWWEIWTEGRFERAGEFYAARYRENLEEGTPEEFAAGGATWRGHFADFTATVEELFSCGGRVVSRVTYRGRHVSDFRALPATGRTFEHAGLDIFEIEDGRIVQHWHETDHWVLWRQLGAVMRPGDPVT